MNIIPAAAKCEVNYQTRGRKSLCQAFRLLGMPCLHFMPNITSCLELPHTLNPSPYIDTLDCFPVPARITLDCMQPPTALCDASFSFLSIFCASSPLASTHTCPQHERLTSGSTFGPPFDYS